MINTFGPRETPRLPARNETARDSGKEFVRLFGSVVYALGRKQGFEDAAAADLVREVLTRAARGEGRKTDDPARDTIRARLVTATRCAMAAARAAEAGRAGATGSITAGESGHAPDLDADWENEFQRQLARAALGVVEREFLPRDWQAFWRTAVDGRTGAAVGRELGMTSGTVHVVKCRVLARLREESHRLQSEAESWTGTTWSTDQPGGEVAQDAARVRSSIRPPQASLYSSPSGPEDVERTSLHIPCFLKRC